MGKTTWETTGKKSRSVRSLQNQGGDPAVPGSTNGFMSVKELMDQGKSPRFAGTGRQSVKTLQKQ